MTIRTRPSPGRLPRRLLRAPSRRRPEAVLACASVAAAPRGLARPRRRRALRARPRRLPRLRLLRPLVGCPGSRSPPSLPQPTAGLSSLSPRRRRPPLAHRVLPLLPLAAHRVLPLLPFPSTCARNPPHRSKKSDFYVPAESFCVAEAIDLRAPALAPRVPTLDPGDGAALEQWCGAAVAERWICGATVVLFHACHGSVPLSTPRIDPRRGRRTQRPATRSGCGCTSSPLTTSAARNLGQNSLLHWC